MLQLAYQLVTDIMLLNEVFDVLDTLVFGDVAMI